MNRSLKNPIIIIFALTVVIFVLILPTIMIPLFKKTPGSFEYIRKGEALLDKGKYVEAIKNFERACESSPENKIIRDNLVHAYSRYASEFAESGRYDEAIDYFTKAHETVQSAYTMQNLAMGYSRRALGEAKSGDLVNAADDFRNAREAVSDSNNAARNLGIIMFNDAVKEFNSGGDANALMLLKEASLVYEDSRIFEFLADIYYKNSELEKALFYFEKAKGMDPENKGIGKKLEKVLKESGLSRKETRPLPHFDIKYEKDLPIDIGLTGAILERAYFDIGKDISYFPGSRTAVFFYSQKNFREIFKTPGIVRAFYDGNIRIPLPEGLAADKEGLASYLYHEYTHAVISAKTINSCPVWLNEGVAVWEEFKKTRPGFVIDLSGKIKEDSDISLVTVGEAFDGEEKRYGDLAIYYIVAYTVVDYIVDNWGLEGLKSILKRIAEGQHFINAVDDEFLLSEKEFQKRWNSFLRKRYMIKREVAYGP